MKVILGTLIALTCLAACGSDSIPATHAPSSTSHATTPPPTPMPTPVSPFPPTTFADLQALAALGSASSIEEIDSETVGLANCPQPKRDVLVVAHIGGETLAEDLLAYWFAQQLNNSCGSLVLAYNAQGEIGEAYTAGSLDLTVTGPSHSLEIDVGSALLGNLQVYTVTY
jgi:hypothetical protein